MTKINCWEFTKCGREQNGSNAEEFGICPATIEKTLNGVHGGMNAGRTCWVVAGSMCDGQLQGTFAQKYEDCRKCDFYQTVKHEEGVNFEISIVLLNRIKPIKKLKIKS